MNVLITNPEFDIITRYLKSWSDHLIMQFTSRNITFIQLNNKRSNHKTVAKFLSKQPIDIFLINGHGGPDRIGGYDNEIIIDTSNAELLSGKSIYALSCNTAATLGTVAVERGAKEYIGYDKDFILISDSRKLSKPYEDTTAHLFLDPAFTVSKSLLNGRTADEAVTQAKLAYARSIRTALNSDIQSDNDKCAQYLFWNMKHLKSCKA